jgi:hypothetical protein
MKKVGYTETDLKESKKKPKNPGGNKPSDNTGNNKPPDGEGKANE